MSKITKEYVRTESGRYMVQIPDGDSQWGFFLTDEEQSYDGGFGLRSWEVVTKDEIPEDRRSDLELIYEITEEEE